MGHKKREGSGLLAVLGLDWFWLNNIKDPFGFLFRNHKDQFCKLLKVWGLNWHFPKVITRV